MAGRHFRLVGITVVLTTFGFGQIADTCNKCQLGTQAPADQPPAPAVSCPILFGCPGQRSSSGGVVTPPMSPNLAVVGSFGGSPAQSPWSKSQANDQQQNAALGHQQPGAPFIVSPTPDYIDIRGFLERLLGFIGFESPGTVIDAEDGEVPKEIPLPKELLWIDQIVNGHGWEDHGQEDFRSKQEYKQAILDTVQNAKGNDVQHPDKFRTLFWNDKEGFAVWRDKNHPDQGTAYFPDSPDAFKKKWGIE